VRILVATDLGPAAADAARAAASALQPADAVAVVHVLPHLHSLRPLFPHLAAAETTALLDLPARSAEIVGRHTEEIMGLARGSFEVFVEEGVDYAEIVRRAEAWKADRLVVGTHGKTGFARLVGDVAERVARYAPCAVLVHRESPAAGVVLAATDLSDPSVPALAAGGEEARRRGAELVVVHAMDFGEATMASAALAPFIVGSPLPAAAFEEARVLARQVIDQHLERLGLKAEVVIVDGPAAKVVVDLAEERGAQLAVVGTRGRTGISRILLGSVAERVVRAAPCSVLVARLEPPAG
jgi:nucleotide-binding universal stress UspA family protein